jgi:hypothetical protein
MRHTTLIILGVLGLAGTAAAGTFDSSEWAQRQELRVPRPGVSRVVLAPATLSAARGDLADLRVVDPAGAEVPLAIERTAPVQAGLRAPAALQATVEDAASVFVVRTDASELVEGLEIDAGRQRFLTRATVEASDDGTNWRLLGRNLPLYNRGPGIEALRVDLPPSVYPHLRLTLDRLGHEHLALRSLSLRTLPSQVPETETVPVRIRAREELGGQTRLTLELPGAHLQLARLELATPEPVFNRAARLVVREFADGVVNETTLAARQLTRDVASPEGARPVPFVVEGALPQQEFSLLVDNGDSPPLALPTVTAQLRPVGIVFPASQAGSYWIYLGNPQASAPRYDVNALLQPAPAERAAALLALEPQPNPGYRPAEALPEIPALGAALDVASWAWRAPVQTAPGGVQQLELAPAVLARSRPDLADLRLMCGDRQVPFVVEHTSLRRELPVEIAAAPDPRQPRLSRWKLRLPEARLPVLSLSLRSSTPLFQRDLRLSEEQAEPRNDGFERTLAAGSWQRTPQQPRRDFTLPLSSPPDTAELRLETDNGDNPPIALDQIQAHYPVTRLLFKAPPGGTVYLYFGHPEVEAPRYDLRLAGPQLLAAPKTVSASGAVEALGASAQSLAGLMPAGVLFWGILAVVVIALIAVIARLLPKAPPAA